MLLHIPRPNCRLRKQKMWQIFGARKNKKGVSFVHRRLLRKQSSLWKVGRPPLPLCTPLISSTQECGHRTLPHSGPGWEMQRLIRFCQINLIKKLGCGRSMTDSLTAETTDVPKVTDVTAHCYCGLDVEHVKGWSLPGQMRPKGLFVSFYFCSSGDIFVVTSCVFFFCPVTDCPALRQSCCTAVVQSFCRHTLKYFLLLCVETFWFAAEVGF